MTAAVQLPDVVTDDLYMTAVEVVDAHVSLAAVKAKEPNSIGAWVNGHETWIRWNDEEYGPAVDRWQATIDQLRTRVPTEPSDALRIAYAVIDAWRASHKTATPPLCDVCRMRRGSTNVDVNGEAFRVCDACDLTTGRAVA